MKRISNLLLVCLGLASANAQATEPYALAGSLNDQGFIVVSGVQDLIGIDLKSPGGYLVPGQDRMSTPFDITLASTPTRTVFGNLGVDNVVALDGSIVLNAQYLTSGAFDLSGEWGGPLRHENGPINFTAPNPVHTAPIPEPTACSLVWVGLFAIGLAFRESKRNRT